MQATPYIAGGKIINFEEPCDYFTVGKTKASTLSLSVLVAIEMFNALNALSEVHSCHFHLETPSSTSFLPSWRTASPAS